MSQRPPSASRGSRLAQRPRQQVPQLAHACVPAGPALSAKHALDRVLAAVMLLVLLPLLLVVAIAVKLSSRGPILYHQRRIGRNGRTFDILKFRSMRSPGVSRSFTPLPGLAPGGVEGEDRRTPVGRLLRHTSLDEFPQLINVLRGEMSFVGPRPERPQFVQLFSDEVPGYTDRHRVQVGITGLAQIRGLRGQTCIASRADSDNEYIRGWSLRLDLQILLHTVLPGQPAHLAGVREAVRRDEPRSRAVVLRPH